MNSEKVLRRLRQRVFDYPPEKDNQVARLLEALKQRIINVRLREKAARPFYHWMYACE